MGVAAIATVVLAGLLQLRGEGQEREALALLAAQGAPPKALLLPLEVLGKLSIDTEFHHQMLRFGPRGGRAEEEGSILGQKATILWHFGHKLNRVPQLVLRGTINQWQNDGTPESMESTL